tara:strand:- start:9 stop:176 length:168 start_codon:yes stop_codon:yes gene_type:complete
MGASSQRARVIQRKILQGRQLIDAEGVGIDVEITTFHVLMKRLNAEEIRPNLSGE